jgi:hypothetical protein
MRKRRWQVEWRAEATSDGLDRLGQMVKLVIDHGVVRDEHEDERKRIASSPLGDERGREEEARQ